MKKLLILTLCCFTLNSLQAQSKKDDKPHKLTFIAGWNYSKYVGGPEATDKSDYKSGLILGLNKDVKLTPFIWMNGGLLYYQNGAETDQGTYRFDYLTIPVGVKVRLGPVYAMGGVYGAYRLTGKIGDSKVDQKDFNRLDFGTYAGAGIRILIFSLNLKYNWGLSDVTNGSSDAPNLDLQNRFFSVTLGVGIP